MWCAFHTLCSHIYTPSLNGWLPWILYLENLEPLCILHFNNVLYTTWLYLVGSRSRASVNVNQRFDVSLTWQVDRGEKFLEQSRQLERIDRDHVHGDLGAVFSITCKHHLVRILKRRRCYKKKTTSQRGVPCQSSLVVLDY